MVTLCLFVWISLGLSNLGETKKDLISGLVDIVMSNDTVPEIEVPIELQDIVLGFYAEETIGDEVTADVLSYLADVYKEHDYYEKGSWAKSPVNRVSRYTPYSGELPEYETGDFIFPIKGPITSYYGYRPKFGRFHKGIDIALQYGDTVKSSLPGVVTKTGYDPAGYGNYVVVSHSGGVETLYAHLTLGIAKPGQKLSAGDAVGLGGSTGNSPGPHLHFETRYRGVALDPLSWFGKAGSLRY